MKTLKILFSTLVLLLIYTYSFSQISHLPITDFELNELIWRYEKADVGSVANIKLKSGGRIEGYSSYNEAKWGIEDKELVFYNEAGQPTARFSSFEKKDGKWIISGYSVQGSVSAFLKETTGSLGVIKTPPKPVEPTYQPYNQMPSGVYARTIKNIFMEYEPIIVEYFNLPGFKQDWITVVSAKASDSTYGEWFYTNGARSGTYTFKGLPAGNYEVRVYFNWPQGGYTVMSRFPFVVVR